MKNSQSSPSKPNDTSWHFVSVWLQFNWAALRHLCMNTHTFLFLLHFSCWTVVQQSSEGGFLVVRQKYIKVSVTFFPTRVDARPAFPQSLHHLADHNIRPSLSTVAAFHCWHVSVGSDSGHKTQPLTDFSKLRAWSTFLGLLKHAALLPHGRNKPLPTTNLQRDCVTQGWVC